MSRLPAEPIRLAAAQVEAVPGDVAGNARRAAAVTARAAGRGARVVVLPELHLCGYDLATLVEVPGLGEVPADACGTVLDQRLDPLAQAAVDHAVTVLAGAAVRRTDGSRTNSVLTVDPAGTVSVGYDKQHLWHDESQVFTAGDRGATVTVDDWMLGLGICYDMSFPEHGRAAALAGAHAYLCPSAFATGGEHRAGIYLTARALENTIFSVFANPVGGPGHRPCNGGTAIYGPDGGALSRAEPAREAVIFADLDPRELARVRESLRMLAECRTARRATSSAT